MLDFHTVLFPKNSRASKISRRKKGLDVRIRKKEESNTFFSWDTVLRVRQVGSLGTPSLSCPSMVAVGTLPSVLGGSQARASGVMSTSPTVCWEPSRGERRRGGERERKRERCSDKKKHLPGLLEPSERSHLARWLEEVYLFRT